MRNDTEALLAVDYKKDFPLLKELDVAYLDNAATAQRPLDVVEAERAFYLKENANPLRGLYRLALVATEAYTAARAAVRDFLNAASTAEIIFTRNATESLNLVAYSYALHNLKPGDEVLTTIMEHHSNLLPWRFACAKTGATLKYLECGEDGTLSLETVAAALSPKTKLVAVTQISNVLGCLNPVREIAALAHQAGAVVVVDAAQSAPHLPLDVQELDADFLAFSGHKMYGPMGIGVLYGKQDLLEAMPPFLRGGEMISWVSRSGEEFAPVPEKFEAGTVNAAAAVGLEAALRYLNKIGFAAIQARERALTQLLFDGICAIAGVRVYGSRRSEEHHGIVSFTLEGVHPHDLAAMLDADGVNIRAGNHCAQPLLDYLKAGATARASLAFYNDAADIRRFLASLASARRRMGYAD